MVITLTGANRYELDRAAKQLTADFVAAEGDMALERLDGAEASIERIAEAVSSPAFLTNRKMVIVKQGSANKAFTEQAADILNDVIGSTDVILVEPKLDRRSRYYTYLKKSTDYREYAELDAGGLAKWLIQTTQQQGGTLQMADARYLVDRVGLNQQLLASELEKLLIYNPTIDKNSIQALTDPTPQSTVFELLEAAFAGNVQQTLRLYGEQRALKVEPQQIIAMLTWQLHVLAIIKAAGDRTPDTIAREAKLSPYVIKKSLPIARKLTLAELKRLLADLITIDVRSKRETFSVDDALQQYLLSLAT